VGPLDVLEHQHERALLGEPLPEAAPGGKRFLLRARHGRALPDQRAEMGEQPLPVVDLLDGALELRAGFLVAVRLQDPRLRLAPLAERPVAHALPVWQRASLPPVRQHAAVLDRLEELADEAALADPRDADEGQELRGALLAHACESADDLLDLALAADERRPRLRREIDPEARMRLHGLPHPNRRLLPL